MGSGPGGCLPAGGVCLSGGSACQGVSSCQGVSACQGMVAWGCLLRGGLGVGVPAWGDVCLDGGVSAWIEVV